VDSIFSGSGLSAVPNSGERGRLVVCQKTGSVRAKVECPGSVTPEAHDSCVGFHDHEHRGSQHRPVTTRCIARMLRELEGGGNPSSCERAAKPATDHGAHLKKQMAPNGYWLITRVHDRQEAVGPTRTST